MLKEMKALNDNDTGEIVQLHEVKRIVSSKWVFIVKYRLDRIVERYKAKLVAQCFTQTYGIDYGETFAPIAKLN